MHWSNSAKLAVMLLIPNATPGQNCLSSKNQKFRRCNRPPLALSIHFCAFISHLLERPVAVAIGACHLPKCLCWRRRWEVVDPRGRSVGERDVDFEVICGFMRFHFDQEVEEPITPTPPTFDVRTIVRSFFMTQIAENAVQDLQIPMWWG